MNKAFKLQNLADGKAALERLVAWDYMVVQLSEYHFRINNRLDVWPSTRKWWDVKTQRKGEYDELESFVKKFIPIQK